MEPTGTNDGETYVTSVRKTEYRYTWVINNFSVWLENVEGEQCSPQFPSGEQESVKWCLNFYPNASMARGDEKSCSLFVELVSSPKGKESATLEFTLADANGNPILRKTCKHEITVKSNWGWNDYVSRDNLLEKVKPVDTLVIKCKITVHSTIVNEKLLKTPKPLPSSLAKDLKTLVDGDNKFGDVTILVAGQRFPAHKCILSARSSVFSAMFEHQMQETIENCVSIDDIEPPVIEALLRFIYTDELASLETMAHALYKAADKYDVPTLKSHCRCHILEKLSWETAAETLMLADLYGDLEMKKHVLQFLSGSVAAKVTETDGWKEMARACPHLVDETIRAMASQLMSQK
uniref:BTB and MATH domain-containing protein 43 n=1 Tax=Culex pipiens TaxID=7175 RepID=A0A8D8NC09_CULPI